MIPRAALVRRDSSAAPSSARRTCRRLRELIATTALAAASTGLAFGWMLVSVRLDTISGAEASNIGTEVPRSIQLAQAFTAALNAHDVDVLVELFTQYDAGPTVTADRFAWQKFEIRLWAQQQVQAGIRMEAYDYRVTEHGAAWTADAYREDWRAVGVTPLRVTNSIWVHNGQLAKRLQRAEASAQTAVPRSPRRACRPRPLASRASRTGRAPRWSAVRQSSTFRCLGGIDKLKRQGKVRSGS